MKELAAAYQTLRAAKKNAATPPPKPATRHRNKDPWDEIKRVRDEAAQRRREQEDSRRRWLLWEELERQARERAEYEASLVTLSEDPSIKIPDAQEPTGETDPDSLLVRRLKAARGLQGNSLTPR